MAKLGKVLWIILQVLLIGNCDAGKTSMRSIIFANYEGDLYKCVVMHSQRCKVVTCYIYPFDRIKELSVAFTVK